MMRYMLERQYDLFSDGSKYYLIVNDRQDFKLVHEEYGKKSLLANLEKFIKISVLYSLAIQSRKNLNAPLFKRTLASERCMGQLAHDSKHC